MRRLAGRGDGLWLVGRCVGGRLVVHCGWSWRKGGRDEEGEEIRTWSGRGGGRGEEVGGTRRRVAVGGSFWRWVGGWLNVVGVVVGKRREG